MYSAIKTETAFIFIGMIALMLTGNLGIGEAVIADRIVARVNNDIITLSELKETTAEVLARMEENLQEEEDLAKKVQEIEKQVLDKLVENRLIIFHAKNMGIAVTEEEITKMIEDIKKQNSVDDLQFQQLLKKEDLTQEDYRKKIKEQLLVSRTFQLEMKQNSPGNDKKELEEYYEKHKERYLIPEEIKLQQILFLCPNDADPLEEDRAKVQAHYARDKLLEGEDFAELAKKYSQDPSAGKGGILGTFKRGQLLSLLEEAAFKLKEGEISPVIQSQFGFHILKAVEKKEAHYTPLSQVEADIRKQHSEEKGIRLHQEWIKKLYQESFVEILYP